jgi:nucleotide-binding universal stress UspA family protein
MIRHILAPTDGTPLSADAMRRAVDLAKLAQARLTFVTCNTPFEAYAADPLVLAHRDEYETAIESCARDFLEAGRKMAREAHVDADGEHVIAQHPWQGILDCAQSRGCDLIVMASHGRHGVAGLLLGSQTQKVLTHSKLPVLVCR